MKTEAEAGAMRPQAQEWLGPPAARTGRKDPPLEPPEGGGPADAWCQTSGLRDRESRNVCCRRPRWLVGQPRAAAQAWRVEQGVVLAPGPGPLPRPRVSFQSPFPGRLGNRCAFGAWREAISVCGAGEALPRPGMRAQLPRDPLACPSPCAGHGGSSPAQRLPAASTGACPSRGAAWGRPEERQVRPRPRLAPRPSGWGGRRVV